MFDNSDGTSFLPDDFDSEDLQAENTFWDAYEGGAADPYANRDPRMKATILTNGTYYKSRYAELYVGGLECSTETTDGTGFMLYKFAQEACGGRWRDTAQEYCRKHYGCTYRAAPRAYSYAGRVGE